MSLVTIAASFSGTVPMRPRPIAINFSVTFGVRIDCRADSCHQTRTRQREGIIAAQIPLRLRPLASDEAKHIASIVQYPNRRRSRCFSCSVGRCAAQIRAAARPTLGAIHQSAGLANRRGDHGRAAANRHPSRRRSQSAHSVCPGPWFRVCHAFVGGRRRGGCFAAAAGTKVSVDAAPANER